MHTYTYIIINFYSILHHELGKLAKDENSNSSRLVRIFFPDLSTTVLQIEEHESCWDVLCKICEKKSLKPGLFSISLTKPTGSNNNNEKNENAEKEKLNLMDAEKIFFSYNCNTVYLVENGEEEEFHSRSSSRRSSTMITPGSRKTTVRLDSQSFPKTIEVAEPPEGDTVSINSESKTEVSKRGSKLLDFS